jgi:hypothetical protein
MFTRKTNENKEIGRLHHHATVSADPINVAVPDACVSAADAHHCSRRYGGLAALPSAARWYHELELTDGPGNVSIFATGFFDLGRRSRRRLSDHPRFCQSG